MRTKTLLLFAAVGAAGAATSMAQVFSVNAVGYVNKTVPANGFAMVSNPLKATDNTIDKLFAGVPNGTQIFVYTPGKGYDVGTYDDLENSFGAPVGAMTLVPGQGVFIKNNAAAAFTVTFVGEVPQGNLKTDLVAGLQIVSSQVPQAGTTDQLNFPDKLAEGLTGGDQVYKFNTTSQKYDVFTFDDLEDKWDNALSLDVGEAVFVRVAKALSWSRTFNVNQ